MTLIACIGALLLALTHIFTYKLNFLQIIPRSVWLSFVGRNILNVIKELLPEERKSRFRAFIAGAAIYSVILLIGE